MNGPRNGPRDGKKLTAVAILVTWALSIIGAVWAASADRTSLGNAVDANCKQLVDHEARLRVVETSITQMARDVAWIRKTMEGGSNSVATDDSDNP